MIFLDFETRSACDLKAEGTYNYVSHPSTDIICMAVFNDETLHKEIWYPTDGPLPDNIKYMLVHADRVAAHYAEFDMGIYEYVGVGEYDFPELKLEQWYCTSAQCRVNALPAGLDDAAFALGLKQRKDHRGANLIKQLSIPQADGTFNRDPNLIKQMGEYCMQDVIVTVDVYKNTRPMTPDEYEDWLVTVEINERGAKVDLELASMSLNYADAEQSEIAEKLLRLTAGKVERHTQNIRIKNWVVEKLGELHPIVEEMVVYKKNVKKLSLDKAIWRNILLQRDHDFSVSVPDKIFEIIQLLDDGNKSSVAKFKRMLTLADPDDHRVRGAFVFAGASQTLRYASRGLQLHNMRRDCWNDEETEGIKKLMRGGAFQTLVKRSDQSVMDALSKLLRPAIIPADGKVFVVGDWSAIEGMVLPWLANTPQSLKKLERFKSGEDIYVSTAIDMGLTEDNRQIGKVAELALGFCGGIGAFQSMARNFGISISDHEAQNNVDRWRAVNPWAWTFGRTLYDTITKCMERRHYGEWLPAGRVKYCFIPDDQNKLEPVGTLVCEIAEGHFIQYPKMQFQQQIHPKTGAEVAGLAGIKAAFKPKADAKAWPIIKFWQGVFSENVTQAFAAALLRNSLRQLCDVVLHTHDEIVMEVPVEYADRAVQELKEVMLTAPNWAKGLPLKMEPKIMTRYGK